MTYYNLQGEERARVAEMIYNIIGKREDQITADMSRDDRIKTRFEYDKLFDKLAKVWAKYGDKALATQYTDRGAIKEGTTPNGKKWQFYMNSYGWTHRTHHCGSLYIEGVGCVFTSGTMAKAFERIFEN